MTSASLNWLLVFFGCFYSRWRFLSVSAFMWINNVEQLGSWLNHWDDIFELHFFLRSMNDHLWEAGPCVLTSSLAHTQDGRGGLHLENIKVVTSWFSVDLIIDWLARCYKTMDRKCRAYHKVESLLCCIRPEQEIIIDLIKNITWVIISVGNSNTWLHVIILNVQLLWVTSCETQSFSTAKWKRCTVTVNVRVMITVTASVMNKCKQC